MLTSPVKIPTSPNFFLNSRNFWLLKAFIGEVYNTLLEFLFPKAIPYSATTVLPLEVCAQTKTFSCFSKWRMLLFWNSSNSNGKVIGGFFISENDDISKSSSIAHFCIFLFLSGKFSFIFLSFSFSLESSDSSSSFSFSTFWFLSSSAFFSDPESSSFESDSSEFSFLDIIFLFSFSGRLFSVWIDSFCSELSLVLIFSSFWEDFSTTSFRTFSFLFILFSMSFSLSDVEDLLFILSEISCSL